MKQRRCSGGGADVPAAPRSYRRAEGVNGSLTAHSPSAHTGSTPSPFPEERDLKETYCGHFHIHNKLIAPLHGHLLPTISKICLVKKLLVRATRAL